MTNTADRQFSHLPYASMRLGQAFARPKIAAVICVVLLTALGWTYLGTLVARTPGWPHGLGAVCHALSKDRTDLADFALSFAMWSAMVFAMMLPSAGPMIFTYAEIADTAARKQRPIVSPFVLAFGYMLVWLAFAACAVLLQAALAHAALLDGDIAVASGIFSGVIFAAAGLYQFSTIKDACLTKCRHPFPFFFTHWKTTARGVFGLGIRQGLYCLGCCWAMMLVMFAVGAMNAIWMAALGAVMTFEKMSDGPRLARAIGIALIVAGVALAGMATGFLSSPK